MHASDIIAHALELARAAQPIRPAASRGGKRGEPAPKPDLSRVINFLAAQPAAAIYCIGLLVYLGRNPWPANFDFPSYYFWMGDAFPNLRAGLEHLAHNPRFADHLERGCSTLAENGYHLDRLLSSEAW